VKRVLQLDGISEYPHDFQRLLDLQKIIDEPLYEVVTAVLEHLDKTQWIDNLQECGAMWVGEMIEEQAYLF